MHVMMHGDACRDATDGDLLGACKNANDFLFILIKLPVSARMLCMGVLMINMIVFLKLHISAGKLCIQWSMFG